MKFMTPPRNQNVEENSILFKIHAPKYPNKVISTNIK